MVYILHLNHHHPHMVKLKRQRGNPKTPGLGLTKLSGGKGRARQGGIVIVGPSGAYKDSRRSGLEGQTGEVTMPSDTEDQMAGVEENNREKNESDIQVIALTKKEKQAIRWSEAVDAMIPWFLDLLKTSENLGDIEIAHQKATLCDDCRISGKSGFKVVCLYFNSEFGAMYQEYTAQLAQDWKREKFANVAMRMGADSKLLDDCLQLVFFPVPLHSHLWQSTLTSWTLPVFSFSIYLQTLLDGAVQQSLS